MEDEEEGNEELQEPKELEEEEEKEVGLRPTFQPRKQEEYISRITLWIRRLAHYAKKINKTECPGCKFLYKCRKPQFEMKTLIRMLSKKGCPHFKSKWTAILGKEPKHDWGF